MSRVPPIAGKDDVPAEHHHIVDDVLGVFGRIRGPFSMLLYSPKLASKLLPMVPFNRDETIVETGPRFAAILAAVREREGAYVWAAQVAAAQRAGVPQSTIDLLRAKGDPASLPEDEADVVAYIRQLMRTNRTDNAVFERLKERHGVQWLVELTAIANYYAMLCGIVNAFEVDIPPDGDRLPASA
jgi:alkylhydroperoxidase family enzyme